MLTLTRYILVLIIGILIGSLTMRRIDNHLSRLDRAKEFHAYMHLPGGEYLFTWQDNKLHASRQTFEWTFTKKATGERKISRKQ